MKNLMSLLAIVFSVGFSAVGSAGNLHVYITAYGNSDASKGQLTMQAKGLCYQVVNNSLWTNLVEKSDKVTQSGGTVNFLLNLYNGVDQFEFQVAPGAEFQCDGTAIESDGSWHGFTFHIYGAKLGSIKQEIYFSGPNFLQTAITINAQTN